MLRYSTLPQITKIGSLLKANNKLKHNQLGIIMDFIFICGSFLLFNVLITSNILFYTWTSYVLPTIGCKNIKYLHFYTRYALILLSLGSYFGVHSNKLIIYYFNDDILIETVRIRLMIGCGKIERQSESVYFLCS